MASAWALLAAAGMAHALTVTSVSPQGEVTRVRQVVAKFDAPAVRFGDPKAPAPFTVSCTEADAAQGTGRWTGEREWVFDFKANLPPGVRCTIAPRSDFQSASGAALAGAGSYQFNTGGPFVQRIWPYASGDHAYNTIDEQQQFVLHLNGPATRESLLARTWCVADSVGERIPVQWVEGEERKALLQGLRLDKDAAAQPLRYATLACNRRLNGGERVQLVYGQGVATPSGVANRQERRYTYRVQEPFAAQFACERENAQADCLPIRPVRLQFNAPVPVKLARAIRLKGASQTLEPRLEGQEPDGTAEADADSVVEWVSFAAPLAPDTRYTLTLPKDMKDAAGRPLRNAAQFPLTVATGPMPPLAKFAAAPFGILERYAEGPDGPALLPVTLRRVEGQLSVQGLQPGATGQVNTLAAHEDAQILQWLRRVEQYNDREVRRDRARKEVKGPLPRRDAPHDKSYVESRAVSLLAGQPGVRTLELPAADQAAPRPFEVVGIPLPAGFHVVEIASPLLGAALLDPEYGSQRTMYVRTAALVTNLAVHFKLGRENALAWVTTLDKGRPVAGARVRVSACDGTEVASATTGDDGVARLQGLSPEPPVCTGTDDWNGAYFVSARAGDDLAFVRSDWQRGIEPWRFNVPTSSQAEPDQVAHTVFDRTLVRAGETVSMKHLVRAQQGSGFALPPVLPRQFVITHVGSGQQFEQPLRWRKTPTGGLSAHSEFHVPPAAKLGVYQASLQGGEGPSFDTGTFRVEEFRLPVLEGRVGPSDGKPLVRVRSVPADVQVNYVSGGGGAARLPVQVSAMVRSHALSFADYDAFSFAPPRERAPAEAARAGRTDTADEDGDDEEPAARSDTRVIADKLPLTLDKNGAGHVTIDKVPAARRPQELVLEATYADPSGEVQTLRSVHPLWPAAVVAGIKTEGWASSGSRVRFQALALSLDGKPLAGVPLAVQASARITTSSRKRMVGGFYSYDNKTETRDLGTVCTGKSDSRGLLLCDVTLEESGQVELVASARDKDGNEAQAVTSVWVTRRGELWFGGEDHDRIDVLPEKKHYEPGETARLQVRMPFRSATALVSVEREGIVDTRVVQLQGQDPTIELPVDGAWAPNVYVSVMVLRGRLREVPWYSFFTWGFKAPREWWSAYWHEGREYAPPTALVDLAKPAYRLGLAELRVGSRAHRMDVQVKADKDSYPVRGKAQVTISATLPGGKPAAGAEVALAAVDQALLELMPNSSWNLLEAMLQRRALGVQTSTAQMEIVGRRHYGKKAVPAGGGGGRAATRELLDTLLLWQPAIRLDERGQATVTVPLNDALTTFKVVAVADAGTGLFGTGATSIRATQDLQIISGLPPLVREGDRFRAQVTLRNTTARAMKVQVQPRATLLELETRTLELAAGDAREVAWDVTAPEQLGQTRAQALVWEVEAREVVASGEGARDALKVSQRIVPAVPITVQQATLLQVDGSVHQEVAPPADALPGRGGLRLAFTPKLAEGLPGVRDWWARYPYSCLEQRASRAIGMNDAAQWSTIVAQLPTFTDEDGLVSYFPPERSRQNAGSDVLTAYLLTSAHEAAALHPEFALPPEARAPLERGLVAFAEGRIQRSFWSPQRDLEVRKLAAIEALARYGKAHARMLTSITIAPNQWPTHAVLHWVNILQRLQGIPEREQRLQEAMQVLRARLSWQGTKVVMSTEREDYWWWLMQSGDTNLARLLTTVMQDPAWRDDLPRLANGFILRQQAGAWHTTTANLWGGLALEKFSRAFEATPVAGTTQASLGTASATVDWARVRPLNAADPQGAAHQASAFGAPASPGNLIHNTAFLSWGSGAALSVAHHGPGKPWLTLQSVAAVPLKEPFAAGFSIRKTVQPLEQSDKARAPGEHARGDVLRVTLEVTSTADMTWVAITDPIPSGATILGSGLGRDSEIATQGEKRSGSGWPAFEERSFEAFRSYYEYLPKGTVKMQYTVRLNNAGEFSLPPSRVEALYAPEMFGEAPNAPVRVVQP